jgi:chromosome transmission fidelity protein 1
MEAGKFPAFPYKPYTIQIDFMNALYHSLNEGGVSMLESPTGLSLSLSRIFCLVSGKMEENISS